MSRSILNKAFWMLHDLHWVSIMNFYVRISLIDKYLARQAADYVNAGLLYIIRFLHNTNTSTEIKLKEETVIGITEKREF